LHLPKVSFRSATVINHMIFFRRFPLPGLLPAWCLLSVLLAVGCRPATDPAPSPPAGNEASDADAKSPAESSTASGSDAPAASEPDHEAADSSPADSSAADSSADREMELNSPEQSSPDRSPTAEAATKSREASTAGTEAGDETVSDDSSPADPPMRRPLPSPDSVSDADPAATDAVDDPPLPEESVRKAFAPPPDTRSLSQQGRLWVDLSRKNVYVDGYVTMRRGPLEMFACPVGTKEHESIVAVLAMSREVHAALLAVGAKTGTPVRFRPEYLPPTGQVIRVWVTWYDSDGKFHAVDARRWIQEQESQQQMDAEWVFAGSGFWTDEEDGKEYYEADSGDMICVSNFATAMLDVSIPSSNQTGSLLFVPFEKRIPELGTPVRLVLQPVPNPTDDPAQKAKQTQPQQPTSKILPRP